ncbi:MAG: hypothetical protein LBI42_09915 [Chitinispirillales bacterium]|nr:hypothetical protein [Chitinispirillales bacterium]
MTFVLLKNCGRLTTAPTGVTTVNTMAAVSEIIRLWKRAISKHIGFSPRQKSFYDHIIRNENDYRRIAEYIENNPVRWRRIVFTEVLYERQ